jgi:NitT/TauT family transport system substrate-binding protein
MQSTQTRRRLLGTLSSATAAGLIGSAKVGAQEAPPETTTVRFPISNNICFAPLYVADELLRAEGFTDIRYVSTASGATGARWVARGDADFDNAFVGTQTSLIDAGERITIVGGCTSDVTNCLPMVTSAASGI